MEKKIENKDYCFTIMPFKGYFDEYYSKIYRQAIIEAGLEPLRADDIYFPGTIINDIWDSIQKSKIILADLTEQNANVFYELGLAHASAKPVILISQTIDDIPFDLRALRIILYDKNKPDWGETLKLEAIRAIQETLKAPLKSILPTFLNVVKNETSFVTASEKILLELKNDIESLKMGQVQRNPPVIHPNLSEQELEIIKLAANGNSSGEIADRLALSVRTVDIYRNRIMEKLKARNFVEVVSIAFRLGII